MLYYIKWQYCLNSIRDDGPNDIIFTNHVIKAILSPFSLIFSQSLLSLDLIEEYLEIVDKRHQEETAAKDQEKEEKEKKEKKANKSKITDSDEEEEKKKDKEVC